MSVFPLPESMRINRNGWRLPWRFILMLALVTALAGTSVLIGVGDFSLSALFSPERDNDTTLLLVVSRIPRTLALVLAGMALSMAGLIMQMISRNRFVEPSTAGTAESASLGLVVTAVYAPSLPLPAKMLIAACFALVGTMLFLQILLRIPLRSVLIVPLVGLMLGGVIDSMATFLAYRFDLLQSLNAWTTGDFSSVLQGRYELLWIGLALTLVAYVAADRFTVAGLGDAFTTNLGLNYRRVMMLGLVIVAMVSAVVVTTVGMIPFLGLIIPNLVSMAIGDNARRAIPWVAASGAGFVLLCDIIGRLVRYPYEIPAGVIAGAVGCVIFLYLLLRPGARHG